MRCCACFQARARPSPRPGKACWASEDLSLGQAFDETSRCCDMDALRISGHSTAATCQVDQRCLDCIGLEPGR